MNSIPSWPRRSPCRNPSRGHPPGPYLTPHFDFHFYTIPAAERDAIDCKDLSKPAGLPAGYGLPDVALPPDMAKMTGEPMVTKAMLMEKKSFDLAIPSIPGLGAHPTKFRAEYDAAHGAYRFTFSAFVPAG